jgi:alpha-tubulin suppressor-like RCC1 family protein
MPNSEHVRPRPARTGLRSLSICAGGLAALSASHHALGQGQVVAWQRNSPNQLSTGTTSLIGFADVAGGADFSLGLRADGTVAFWGWAGYGIPMPVGLGGVTQIAAGSLHRAAVKADGSVVCWGDNFDGCCEVPPGIGAVKSISLGESFCAALQADGVVRCWGRNNFSQCVVPPDLPLVTSIAAGKDFVVAATTGGSVRCWGSNSFGQRNPPGNLSGVTQVSAGFAHGMALRSNGTVECWGLGAQGQCSVPPGLSGVIQIAARERHSVALRSNGTVECWGDNSFGQRSVPAGLSGVTRVATGAYHVMAAKSDGTIVCWGGNFSGQCEPPRSTLGVVQISAGAGTSVAVRADGTVEAWGGYSSGAADPPDGLSSVVQASTGGYHGMALKSNGTVVCWGNNASEQCSVPSDLSGVSRVSAGASHSMAMLTGGTVRCWGSNEYGQRTVPFGLNGVIGVSAGGYHSLALRSNGTVVAWGAGQTNSQVWPNYGQSIVPPGLASVVQVAGGHNHSAALRSNGTVSCWGLNSAGQCNVPDGLSGVMQIAAGENFTLALKADGTVVGWEPFYTPVPANLSRVTQIAAGAHALALLEPGASSCGNSGGSGTATLNSGGAGWANVEIWTWSNGGGPQVPGALSTVDLGTYGSVGAQCNAQCATLMVRSGSTLIVPVDLSAPSTWGNHSIAVSGIADMAGRVWLLGSGASVLPANLNVPVLTTGEPKGSFDVIQTSVPPPPGKFLALVSADSLGGGTAYSLRLLDLPGGASLTGGSSDSFSGNAVAAEAMDWNGDGFDDLALAIDMGSSQPGRLQVLLNDGAGNLGGTSVQVSTPPKPQCLAVGDINLDGRIDAVVCVGSDQTGRIYLNAFSGSTQGGEPFTAGAVLPVGGNPLSAVVIPPESSSSLAWSGPGSPGVGMGSGGSSAPGGEGPSIKVFNPPSVQTPQVIPISGSPNTLVRRGRQLGTAGNSAANIGGSDAGFLSVLTPNAQGLYVITQSVNVPAVPMQADAADIDGDTYIDIVTANASPQSQGVGTAMPIVTLFRGSRLGVGLPVPIAPIGATSGRDVSLVDTDNDRVRDLVSVHSTAGGGTKATLIAIDTPGPGRPLTIGAQRDLDEAEKPVLSTRGNLDGVGSEDLFLVDAGVGSSLAGGGGPSAIPYVGDPSSSACIADVNGDGDRDGVDLSIVLAGWGMPGPADINSSGTVDGVDLAFLLANWGPCQ